MSSIVADKGKGGKSKAVQSVQVPNLILASCPPCDSIAVHCSFTSHSCLYESKGGKGDKVSSIVADKGKGEKSKAVQSVQVPNLILASCSV